MLYTYIKKKKIIQTPFNQRGQPDQDPFIKQVMYDNPKPQYFHVVVGVLLGIDTPNKNDC
ncbi:hypothetical protein Hdeb2414_s0010g00342521 [Helianthus debilis subsp. tardiflorus]